MSLASSVLIIHPATRATLEAAEKRPSHALLLIGPNGFGKSTLAQALAESLLDVRPGNLPDYPYARLITPEKSTAIGIESIRDLQHFLSLKIPVSRDDKRKVARLIIIEQADTMTIEAQNALLKMLEEPPADTCLILVVAQANSLLSTIRSRSQIIQLAMPDLDDLEAYFTSQSFAPADIKRAILMSGGLPGLTRSLLDNNIDHPLVLAAQTARSLLQQTTFERLATVDSLSKQTEHCRQVLFILQQMASLALRKTTNSNSQAKRWLGVLKAATEAEGRLRRNAQPKLVLTNLMLSL
jgi:DNA polymerase-3 subunit delta'